MTPRCQALAMTALAVLTISLGGCSDLSLGLGCSDILSGEKVGCGVDITFKAIEITTITVGEDIDPDGYRVEIRHGLPGEGGSLDWWGRASANGKETYKFRVGGDGDHTVELKDVASNCVVSGDNPRVVWIEYSKIAKTTFGFQCTAIPRTT